MFYSTENQTNLFVMIYKRKKKKKFKFYVMSLLLPLDLMKTKFVQLGTPTKNLFE